MPELARRSWRRRPCGFLADAADAAVGPLAGAGPGHLGGPRRTAALPVFQADVLGGGGPRHHPRRGAAAPTDRVPRWTARPGADRRLHPRQRLERRRRRLHPGVRRRTTRRLGPDARRSSASCPPTTRGSSPRSRPIEQRLTDGRGLVYRYHGDDGLPGEEGAFLLCTFWLAHALALAGLIDRARSGLRAGRRIRDRRLGLMAEEVDAGQPGAAGQLPAGVQPHRTGQRGLGDQRS